MSRKKVITVGTPLPITSPKEHHYLQTYCPELAERMAELYCSGYSIKKIAEEPGMPAYGTILRWVQSYPEFKSLIDAARAVRALHYEEEAIAAAQEPTNKDDVPAANLKFTAYKWGSEVNDPCRYGKKVTHEGNADKPITFIINTGVPQSEQKAPEIDATGLIIEAECSEVKDDS